jgi:hypothetical protein
VRLLPWFSEEAYKATGSEEVQVAMDWQVYSNADQFFFSLNRITGF